MTTTASPLSDAQLESFLFAAKHQQDNEGDFWKAKDIHRQLADLRAKQGELLRAATALVDSGHNGNLYAKEYNELEKAVTDFPEPPAVQSLAKPPEPEHEGWCATFLPDFACGPCDCGALDKIPKQGHGGMFGSESSGYITTPAPADDAELEKRVDEVLVSLDRQVKRWQEQAPDFTEKSFLKICRQSERDAYLFARSLKSRLHQPAAPPQAELYVSGYFSDRSKAGELAPGHGGRFTHHHPRIDAGFSRRNEDKSAGVDVERIDALAEQINSHNGWNGTLGTIKTIKQTLEAYFKLRAGQPALQPRASLYMCELHETGDGICALSGEPCPKERRVKWLKDSQPARQPVTGKEMFAAFNAAEKLWVQDVQSDKTQWEYYYDAILVILKGRV